MLRCLLLATVCAAVTACAVADDPDIADGEGERFTLGKADTISVADGQAVLALVNGASFEVLDDDVPLDARAAAGIIDHRDGADGQPGTGDDDPFESLAELDAIAWVGPVAFDRLLAYALAHGFGSSGPASCLILSEYIELHGQYNKAVELFNCGSQPVNLADFELCMVRNDDDGCTVTADLGSAELDPGDVTTVCRTQSFHPASTDPYPPLAQGCQLERAGVMTFSGDDRLLVRRSQDGAIVDALGRVGYRPPESTWSNVILQRCDFTPADGTSFYDDRDYFVRIDHVDLSSWGQPPAAACGDAPQ